MSIDHSIEKYGPFGKDIVLSYIPHRDPFLFVDEIHEVIPGRDADGKITPVGTTVVGTRQFKDSEQFFKGHFPGYPITPGVIITESIGQIGTFAFYPFLEEKKLQQPNGDLLKLVGVNSGRFRAPVLPNDTIEAHARLVRGKRGIWIFDCTASVNGKTVVECELVANYNLNWKM